MALTKCAAANTTNARDKPHPDHIYPVKAGAARAKKGNTDISPDCNTCHYST